MAISVTQEFPATVEQYDQVNEKLNAEADPPKGLIVHCGTDLGGSMRVYDVWESEADWNDFLENRLGPAVVEVMGPPPEGAEPPPIEIKELHDVVKP